MQVKQKKCSPKKSIKGEGKLRDAVHIAGAHSMLWGQELRRGATAYGLYGQKEQSDHNRWQSKEDQNHHRM